MSNEPKLIRMSNNKKCQLLINNNALSINLFYYSQVVENDKFSYKTHIRNMQTTNFPLVNA